MAVLVLMFAFGSVQSAWAWTAGAHAMPMPNCDMGGTSCPYNNGVTCVEAHIPAVPAMTVNAGNGPVWIALPATCNTPLIAPESVRSKSPDSDYPVISSGPPLHLRFCSFLK